MGWNGEVGGDSGGDEGGESLGGLDAYGLQFMINDDPRRGVAEEIRRCGYIY